MPKFFIERDNISLETTGKKLITFTGEEAYHLSTVLRMKPGAVVTATDGQGVVYYLELTEVNSTTVCGEVLRETRDHSEPTLRITLLQSILKGEKMDWVLQKGTEIGISAFIPFLSTRTVARPEPKHYRRKQERWQKIVAEAAKQSGRGIIPTVNPITPWARLAKILSHQYVIVAWEEEKSLSLRTALAGREKPAEVFLIIGPEGGLAEEEVEELSAWGALPVSLGPRILRAETAGPVTAALILYHFGELEPIPSTFLSSGE